MGIAASVVSAVLKAVVGDKLGDGLAKELAGISIDGISEKGIHEISDFINGGKDEIENILSKGQKELERVDDGFGKLSADNRVILEIIQMILAQKKA